MHFGTIRFDGINTTVSAMKMMQIDLMQLVQHI